MGQYERNQFAKIVCCIVGCLIAYQILMSLLPFIEMCFAIIGAAFIYYEYKKNNRR